MKFFVPLSLLATVFFTSCSTDVTQRDLYAPKKGDGPYTKALENGTWNKGVAKPVGEPATTR